jgi:hypothetical protein
MSAIRKSAEAMSTLCLAFYLGMVPLVVGCFLYYPNRLVHEVDLDLILFLLLVLANTLCHLLCARG